MRSAELLSFGLVGGVSFVVDVGLYNLLRLTLLDDKPIGAKIVSVIVATVVAWLGNRYLTFRTGGQRSRAAVVREGVLFAAVNVVGLGIASACLFISHYLLGFESTLADNIAGNGVGLVLGMLFRYLAYRFFVFRKPRHPVPAAPSAQPSVSRTPGE
ncbi:GtrA family protein [Leifsonia lichenia]